MPRGYHFGNTLIASSGVINRASTVACVLTRGAGMQSRELFPRWLSVGASARSRSVPFGHRTRSELFMFRHRFQPRRLAQALLLQCTTTEKRLNLARVFLRRCSRGVPFGEIADVAAVTVRN